MYKTSKLSIASSKESEFATSIMLKTHFAIAPGKCHRAPALRACRWSFMNGETNPWVILHLQAWGGVHNTSNLVKARSHATGEKTQKTIKKHKEGRRGIVARQWCGTCSHACCSRSDESCSFWSQMSYERAPSTARLIGTALLAFTAVIAVLVTSQEETGRMSLLLCHIDIVIPSTGGIAQWL